MIGSKNPTFIQVEIKTWNNQRSPIATTQRCITLYPDFEDGGSGNFDKYAEALGTVIGQAVMDNGTQVRDIMIGEKK